MEVVHSADQLARYTREAVKASPEHPVLVDRFLRDAVEVDLDLIADRTGAVLVGGLLEHIEEAGVHSGDAASVMPPHSLSPDLIERMKDQAAMLARELGVVGLMNVQFAIQGKTIYVLEVNPRASRTVPFVSKVTGIPLAKVAARCMVGQTLAEQGLTQDPEVRHFAVKESVFPFARFQNVDVLLGPEMKSTGEVMGLDANVALAFAKSQLAAGTRLPSKGRVFISVKDDDKPAMVDLARRLTRLGFQLVVTEGTGRYLRGKGIATETVRKVREGSPHIVEQITRGEIAMVFNTTQGQREVSESYGLRREALMRGTPYFTTAQAARMVVEAVEALAGTDTHVKALQDYLRK
jgi:carbamoyl-phosphate synthase large subunit